MTLVERLKALMRRLDDEGQYVDANIVWLAVEEIVNRKGLEDSKVPAEDRSR